MVLDTASIRLLRKKRNYERNDNKARINVPLASSCPYLVVFQAEIGDATHGGRLALGKILVHLVNAL